MSEFHAEITNIVVYDSVLFGRTGDVGRWARRVENRFTLHAWEEAPDGWDSGYINKSRRNAMFPAGSLKESVMGDVRRVGVRHFVTTISVNVPYAMFVIGGTNDIFPTENSRARFKDGSPALYLPPNNGHTRTRHRWVSGQESNNFLQKAGARTARTHRSLQGFVFGSNL